MTRLHPPESVREICRTLERAGHEAWCVGGAVRDALLGIETLDWDIATSALPEQVQKLFRRTIPVGVQFGTVGVLDKQGVLHEVTTFRHDVETDGRHAVVRFGASLTEDLARRDFTINAIAVHPETLEVRDPFDGRADLAQRIVRCVGEPAERMREDRLRALRALRFAGRFDFALDAATWLAIVESAPHLSRLSMERVKQELEKVMEQVARPSVTLQRYREAGIFAALIPALADAPRARFAAIDHLARPGLVRRPDRRMLRLAALFVEPGAAPARTLERDLKALKFSNDEVRATLTLARGAAEVTMERLREIAASSAGAAAGAAAGAVTREADASAISSAESVELRRVIARVGRLMVPGLSRLLWARAKAEGIGAAEGRVGVALYRKALRSAFADPLTVGDLAIDGDDLRQAGVPAGKAMGETLQRLLELVLVDPRRNTRESLLAHLREG
jgi:tRNA nucleotidyltransferase/poly(A) polymerase